MLHCNSVKQAGLDVFEASVIIIIILFYNRNAASAWAADFHAGPDLAYTQKKHMQMVTNI